MPRALTPPDCVRHPRNLLDAMRWATKVIAEGNRLKERMLIRQHRLRGASQHLENARRGSGQYPTGPYKNTWLKERVEAEIALRIALDNAWETQEAYREHVARFGE